MPFGLQMSAAERLLRRHLNPEEHRHSDVLAWDLPTRAFKWTLVVSVVTAWVSSGFDDPAMTVHKAAGYTILTLVIYRILWGFLGGTTARFSTFLASPAAVVAYLKTVRSGTEPPYLGHNPAGGLMIIGLLFACAVQVALGLFSSDGVLASGPFADAIGATWSSMAATLHSIWFYVILGLAVVHIGVNLFHQFVKRDNLIGAMITGRQARATFVDIRNPKRGSSLIALLCLAVAIGLVYGAVILSGGTFFAG
ncbi:cytochrome b/b6 domain-containing protein [Lichenifustis flavocetrariae]|uniref:Cytochrome b/b6 domain-containing protein n=1 Tax=Lichenifustis flavocetrariae TaxID=2949735 RepID=A0AA41Z241_9HYPH|nr:cytochrome b/b6 domain-containing protein [Lichenifustis flavocetrariae]MCW6512809.1 cytochrome b/b6 domain-containing protein [Lichenifustis flavocetrariae]